MLVGFLVPLAIVVQIAGWFRLGIGVWEFQDSFPDRAGESNALKWAFIAMPVGLFLGLAVGIVLAYPIPFLTSVLVLFLLPYIPSIYAWPVFAQVALFLIGSRMIARKKALIAVYAGTGWLVAVVTLSLIVQFGQMTAPWAFVLGASLPSVGYLLVAVGYRLSTSIRSGAS
ncbi:MAG: hypothetical protein ACE5EW_01790 [Thermoplasmata archaeon]